MSVLQNSESRRRLVRRLEVDASNGDWRSCRQLRLPNLSQLLVYGWPRHHVEPKAYYGLLTSSTHLQEVIIQGAHVKGLGGILARWSNLSSLAIREPVDRAIPRMSDDHVPFSALTSLEYTWADLRTGLLPRIAPNTLRSLKLDHVYFYIPNPLSHLLETVLAGHPIEYLKIANCERKRHRHEPIPSIAHLSSLMHLEFYDNDFSFADPATQIPLTLNKLSLSYAWGSPAQILELAQKMTPEPNDARKRHFCISGIARIHDPEWGGVCKQVSALGIFLELSEGALEKDRMFGDSMEYSTDDEGLDNLKSSDSESEGHSSGDDEMTVPVLW